MRLFCDFEFSSHCAGGVYPLIVVSYLIVVIIPNKHLV